MRKARKGGMRESLIMAGHPMVCVSCTREEENILHNEGERKAQVGRKETV